MERSEHKPTTKTSPHALASAKNLQWPGVTTSKDPVVKTTFLPCLCKLAESLARFLKSTIFLYRFWAVLFFTAWVDKGTQVFYHHWFRSFFPLPAFSSWKTCTLDTWNSRKMCGL